MPANYEDDDQPMAGGREWLGDRRFQPCAWLPQARSYLRNADPVLARLSNDGVWEASQSTNGKLCGAYPKNDNDAGRMLTEIVTIGQSTKIMEYVCLLLKAQATPIFRDAGLAAELVRRQLKEPEIPREVIRISDMGSHARRQAGDPVAATAIAESLRIFT
jgi:hypothetical protein